MIRPHLSTGQRPDRFGLPKVAPVWAILPVLLLLAPIGPAWPTSAVAQSPNPSEGRGMVASDSLALTLEEAFRRALGSNPAYRQTSNDLELNRIERREAWLSLLPQPSVTLLSTSVVWERLPILTDIDGNPLPNPETNTVQRSSSGQGAGLDLSVNFANFLNLRDQETQAEMRQANIMRDYQDLEADVTRAFFDAQEQTLTVELEEELLENALANREVAQRLYRLARSGRTDLLEAELNVADQENALEDARFAYSNTLLSLRNLIGDPELRNFHLVEVPVRVFDPSYLDEEELAAFARNQAPSVIQQQSSIEVARRNVTRGHAEWLPTLNMSFRTSRQEAIRDSGGAFFQPTPDGEWGRNIGLSLSFPDLGQYFNRRNTTRTREISVANAEEQLRQVRMELDQDIRSQLVTLRSAYRSVALQDRRVELAREQMELQFESYRLGRSDFSDLQQATENTAQARRQALQARYSFEQARISLEQALGIPLEVPAEAYMDEGNDSGEG